ncbi:MAG: tripartite tricarboxylate transporter permease [Planctomycetota bacterium]|jgi:putative tricarboxylic transport membrane protein|nr:tripartite tricarboxylate transporter permease [Planctomycetota bacterium]
MLEQLLGGLSMAITLDNLLFMLAGTVLGILFGSIPGLTFSTALVLIIPLTFDLSPICALSLLLGIYSGGMSGGAISAILLGIPGTPSAAATVIDGHPMYLKGEGGPALGMAVFASVFGGLFSLIMLMLIAPHLANFALSFGPPEIFAMLVFGLSTIVSLSGGDLVKGLIAGATGLFITTVGLDPVMGTQRFVFGQVELMAGIDIMPVMIGMFALPEIVNAFQTVKRDGEIKRTEGQANAKARFPNWREFKRSLRVLLTSSAIGTVVGAIPGTGGPIACFLAYDAARKQCPACGTGVIEGVAAPEAANNGVTGGALIPLLTLGIPGDAATAIMLGAFLVHGIAPGPLLFRDHGDLIYAIFLSIFIIYIMVFFVQFHGVRLFLKVMDIPKLSLMSIILVLSVVGSYAVKNSFMDIVLMGFFGFVSYGMKKHGFPVTPLILAVVLGDGIESSFRKALMFSDGSPAILLSSWVSSIFILLAFLMLFSSSGIYRKLFGKLFGRKAARG